jgi:hypothetical protein
VNNSQKREQTISLIGVVVLAILLPGILKLTNSVVRLLVGAEGRLAAIAVETNRVLGPLPKPWKALAQGGENLDTFLDEGVDDVRLMKPDYIRIDHIYDQFDVVKSENGNINYSWDKLDLLVNKILKMGSKPFFSLSYMPPSISSGSIVDQPVNWSDWENVVQKTIEHYSGELKISDVYYEVWNEPDLFGEWKMNGKKDYKLLYQYASRGASKATGVEKFKLGGPATTGLYKNWVDEFFPYVLKNNLRLDFFSWHRYDLGLEKYIDDVDKVDVWIEKHPYFSQVEKIVSEYGPKSEKGGENDTKIGASHLISTMRELMSNVKYAFAFSIKGSWGVVGKPRADALKMLADLGSQRLAITGEGSWISAIGAMNDKTYQVLLSNYDPKGLHSEVVPVTFINLKDKEFILKRRFLGGVSLSEKIATSESVLQKEIPMTPNSVVLLELEPVTNEL